MVVWFAVQSGLCPALFLVEAVSAAFAVLGE